MRHFISKWSVLQHPKRLPLFYDAARHLFPFLKTRSHNCRSSNLWIDSMKFPLLDARSSDSPLSFMSPWVTYVCMDMPNLFQTSRPKVHVVLRHPLDTDFITSRGAFRKWRAREKEYAAGGQSISMRFAFTRPTKSSGEFFLKCCFCDFC